MFDLPSARAPELLPLQGSWEPGDYRDDIKRLALALFADHLGDATFDANVLGVAHLGSLELVRRFIHGDGLAMLRSDIEAPATRYLYRAWQRADTQGRGLHFLRTYLQLIYPNAWQLDQLEQSKAVAYPLDLRPRSDTAGATETLLQDAHGRDLFDADGCRLAADDTPDDTHFLTSRILIQVDASAKNAAQIAAYAPIISAVLPARIVPDFGLIRVANMPSVVGAFLGGFAKSLVEPKFKRTATLPTQVGIALGGLCRNRQEPKFERYSTLPISPRTLMFGLIRDRRPLPPWALPAVISALSDADGSRLIDSDGYTLTEPA